VIRRAMASLATVLGLILGSTLVPSASVAIWGDTRVGTMLGSAIASVSGRLSAPVGPIHSSAVRTSYLPAPRVSGEQRSPPAVMGNPGGR
jgi:hypothetical protein